MTYTIIGGDNKEYGPISGEDMRLWISEGRLNAQTQVKGETDTAWRALGTFREFADVLSPTTPPPIGSLSPGAAPATSAAATAPLNPEGDYELDIGGCVSRGWNLYKENFGFLFLAFLIVFALTIVTSMALGSIVAIFIPKHLLMESEAARQFQHLVLSVGVALVAGPLSGGMYRAFLKKSRQEPVDFGEVFSGFSHFTPLFLGYLAITLVSSVCMLPYNFVTNAKIMPILAKMESQPAPQEMQDLLSQLISAFMSGLPVLLICLVPATYLLVSLQFTLPLIADKNMGVGQAFKTSWVMVNKHWFQLFGLTIVLGLITLAGLLGCCVGILFTIPLSIAGLMAAYESIFGAARKN